MNIFNLGGDAGMHNYKHQFSSNYESDTLCFVVWNGISQFTSSGVRGWSITPGDQQNEGMCGSYLMYVRSSKLGLMLIRLWHTLSTQGLPAWRQFRAYSGRISYFILKN